MLREGIFDTQCDRCLVISPDIFNVMNQGAKYSRLCKTPIKCQNNFLAIKAIS